MADGELRLYWQSNDSSLPRERTDTLLRATLAPLMGLPEHALMFGREEKGRPFLDHPNAPDFNLSDTRGGTLIAIGMSGRVGVDVEWLHREVAANKLASRYFSAEEAAALAQMTSDHARLAFLRLWTAKEASCKATGTGILGYLQQWRFDVDSESPQLHALPADAGSAEQWRFIRLAPTSNHTAVLALRNTSYRQVNVYTLG